MGSRKHGVYRLDPAEIDRNDRFGVTCATGKCKNLATHATRWDYVTGRAGRVSTMTRQVCAAHAEAFARKHNLTIGDPPQRPGRAGVIAAAAMDGATNSVRVHCLRGRQWYLEQHRGGGLIGTFSQPLVGIPGTATLDQAITEAETHLALRQGDVPAGAWQRGDGEASVEVIPAYRHQQWSARPWQLTVACDDSGMWKLTRSLDDRFAPVTNHLGNHNMSLSRALAVATQLLADEQWRTDPGGWVTSDDNTARQAGWHPDQPGPPPAGSGGPDPQPAAAAPSAPSAAPRPPFRLIVTGSRSWTDDSMVKRSLDKILARHPEGVVVVHGACPEGAEAIADAYASCTPGFTVERHPADWYGPCRPQCQPGHRQTRRPGDPQDYCPDAGSHRNEEIASLGAGGCVAFHHGNSPETSDMIHAASQHGIPVWNRRPDPKAIPQRPGRSAHGTLPSSPQTTRGA